MWKYWQHIHRVTIDSHPSNQIGGTCLLPWAMLLRFVFLTPYPGVTHRGSVPYHPTTNDCFSPTRHPVQVVPMEELDHCAT